MANVPLSAIIPKVKNAARNQNLTDARCISAIDSALTLVRSQFGIPGFERQYQFHFFDSFNFYTQPVDFSDPISLRFDDDRLNGSRRFTYKPGELLYPKIENVDHDTLLWGHDYSTGAVRMIVIAKNSIAGFYIDSMATNNTQYWFAFDDATNIRDDQFFQYPDGQQGALEYDINAGFSGNNRATIVSYIGPFDWSQQLDNGYYTAYHYIPNITNLTSLSVNVSSDGVYPFTNYAKMTVTTQADGTPFIVGLNTISWPLSTMVVVGTPNFVGINVISLQDNYTGAYVPTPDFRWMGLQLEVPDLMDETYYTAYKGTTSTGTPLLNFSATTDLMSMGSMGEADLQELVALQAAIIVNPTLLVDDKSVSALYTQYTKVLGMRYPKKRTNNLLAEPKIARTSVPF